MDYFKVKVPRDKKYLRWIAQKPCLICEKHNPTYRDGMNRETVVYHHIVIEGRGIKCSDYRTVPLCYYHHQGSNNSAHYLRKKHDNGLREFEVRFEVDLEVESGKLYKEWGLL